LLGRSVVEIGRLTNREIERWKLYWREEPWGPIRDNTHAAMIVTELLKPHLKEGAKISIGDYMLKLPEDREAETAAIIVQKLDYAAYQERRAARRAARTAKQSTKATRR
jgi:hypothetical protein